MHNVLEPYGFRARTAGYKDADIRLFVGSYPGLILLDWKWPELRASRILDQLKTDEQTKNIPVYVIVSDMPGSIIKQSKQLGAEGYFVKSPKHILAEITTGKPSSRFSSCAVNLKQLKQRTSFEQLTNIDSSRFTELYINDCIKQLQRYSWQFGLLLFDIGHSTTFDDSFEQDTSNNIILRREAQVISANTRSFDHTTLWGQKKVISTIVNVDYEKLDMIAGRLKVLAEKPFDIYGTDTVSVKVAVSSVTCRSNDDFRSLFNRLHSLVE
jgi:PleD family two-component response regulator